MDVHKRVLRLKIRVKFKWLALRNWCKGFKFGPVQRYRCCDHTTPTHYRTCPDIPQGLPDGFYIHSDQERIALHDHVGLMTAEAGRWITPALGVPLYINDQVPPGVIRLVRDGATVKDIAVR